MTTGQHPQTLRTAKQVATDVRKSGNAIVNPRRRELVPIGKRRNRHLSRFEPAA